MLLQCNSVLVTYNAIIEVLSPNFVAEIALFPTNNQAYYWKMLWRMLHDCRTVALQTLGYDFLFLSVIEQAEKQLELQLFKLYHNEREIDELNEELSSRQRVLTKEQRKAGKIEDEVKDKKKDQGTLIRQLGKVDQQIKEAVRMEILCTVV